MLLKLGAHVNKKDSAKMTPIFYAVKYHHKQCMKALIEAGADIEVTKPNGDTLIHEAAIYDSADCLIELAAQGLSINTRNNLMRTPIYMAEAKRAKYAYQALLNLEKAIVMTNAFTERKYYGEKQPKQSNKLGLKSSLRASAESPSKKKKVRIKEEEEEQNESRSDPEEHETEHPDQDELTARQKQLRNLQHLMNLRQSMKSSNSGEGFSNVVQNAVLSQEHQEEMLKEILEREKEEIRQVEQQLGMAESEHQKQDKIHNTEKFEKAKRWQVIDQKREMKNAKRNYALNEEYDPMKIAEELEKQEEDKENANAEITQEIDLSSPTSEETREKRAQDRENEGKLKTFKKFLEEKHGKPAKKAVPPRPKKIEKPRVSEEGMVNLRESHPDTIRETIHEESIESEISEQLNFSNQDRSFEQHPCEVIHKSEESDEDSIRMSRNTLRQIKMKRSKSQGPMGRAFAYLDTRSIAESSISRISSILQRLRKFMNENYESIKEWLYVQDEEPRKKSKKRVSSQAKKQLPNVEEMVRNIQQFGNEEEKQPKGKSTADIVKKHRTFGKTAQEMIFEEDLSDIASDEPSMITKQKIKKLKQDERNLKLFEIQVAKELKELKTRVSLGAVEKIEETIDEKIAQKKPKKAKKKTKKKRKAVKAHHDMKRMKQEKIKKLLNKDLKETDEEQINSKILVKDFKSDHESSAKPIKTPKQEIDRSIQACPEAVEIQIEPLEKSTHSIKENTKKLTPERKDSLNIMPPSSPNFLVMSPTQGAISVEEVGAE